MTKIRIGTRGSQLALWQAHYTQAQLRDIGVASELVIIKTQGDLVQHLSFDKLEGKGFFTKEIEDALLRGEVDVAVHSMKDLPTTPPEGLLITAVSYRHDPSELLLLRREAWAEGQIFKLKQGAIVGSSSNRRKAQMLDIRPDVTMQDIRGNVPTRVEKLRQGTFDAIFLAAAGVERLDLDLTDLHTIKISPREFIPAPAQGVLAWQTNQHDTATRLIFKQLHQSQVSAATNVERRVLQQMDGGCQLPLGVYCERDAQGNFHAFAACGTDSGLRRARASSTTNVGLAEQLLCQLR
jgi:hydroxymethylbilane synthase